MRKDCHRPSQLIPADYQLIRHYNLSTTKDGWPIPAFGITCQIDYRNKKTGENGSCQDGGDCCVISVQQRTRAQGRKVYGSPGQCGVCGVRFVYGEIWRHIPTGDAVHIGHICANNYRLYADRSEFDREYARFRRQAIKEAKRQQLEADKQAFLDEHPGLFGALQGEHYILASMRDQLQRNGKLSDKQVKLAFDLVQRLAERDKEVYVKAPTSSGRTEFRGEIVSIKDHLSQWGYSTKITVKVTTPDGIWLAWGTCPSNLDLPVERGTIVALRAGLKPGNEPHFAIMTRPYLIG